MKRSTDDVPLGSQNKRSIAFSRGEDSVQSQMMGGGNTNKLTANDALTYLKAVEEVFHDNKQKYDDFLQVLKDYGYKRIDTAVVTKRVQELFKGHPELIFGFNVFLPKEHEIILPLCDQQPTKKKPDSFKAAVKYVKKIKNRFKGEDDRVYKSFLDILNLYREGSKPICKVKEEVCLLFNGHADLLPEFYTFMPHRSSADQ